MEEPCLLCGNKSEVIRPDTNKMEYFVTCPICKAYTYDDLFKTAYKAIGIDERAMISALTRECFELGTNPPILRDPDSFKDQIEKYKNKTIDQKVDNMLLYIRNKSKFLGQIIPFNSKNDFPITYSPNQTECRRIGDIAVKRNNLIRGTKEPSYELSSEGWQRAELLVKEIRMNEENEKAQFLSKLMDVSKGDVNNFVDTMDLANEIGINREKAFIFVRYFDQKGLVLLGSDDGQVIRITAKGIDEVEKKRDKSPELAQVYGNDVFIVHGSDVEIKESVARFIEKMGPNVVILHELPNAGRTIIEKFEDYSKVGFAVVLFSPDDLGASKNNKDELRPRARQNVVLELGYFIGKLGRRRVCVLYREGVEMPSDYNGVIYVKYDNSGAWKKELAREFQEANIKMDLSKLLI